MKIAAIGLSTVCFLLASEAGAAALCGCCGTSTPVECEEACRHISANPRQCFATLDMAAQSGFQPEQNPLYRTPLNLLILNENAEPQREILRRLLERARRGAEADRRKALADSRAGRIDSGGARALAWRYEDAMVNYHLGMRARRSLKQNSN